MKKNALIIFGIILVFSFFGCGEDDLKAISPPVDEAPDDVVMYSNSQGVQKTNEQKVYVHYMPWFEDPSTLGANNWGYHWKMQNTNPNLILPNGRRNIASWFYPMIGTYASSNQDVIDYHFLLMKYSGIDGIIVDWYGTHNVYDYPQIKNNTTALFNRLSQTNGLEFAICYEDATLNNVQTIGGIDKITAAKADFTFLKNQYFNSANYIKINNKPLLMCFGPQGLLTPEAWQSAFSVFSDQPHFLALQDHQQLAGTSAIGNYAWVQSTHLTNLNNYYASNNFQNNFGVAYPGFRDYYAQGITGGSSYFTIDHQNTLQKTLELSSSKTQYVQLATWNDYGEGTMIEPTLDFEFSSLETIQKYTGVSYSVTELKLVYKWFTLKKLYPNDAAIQIQLQNAFNALSQLKVADAKAILDPLN